MALRFVCADCAVKRCWVCGLVGVGCGFVGVVMFAGGLLLVGLADAVVVCDWFVWFWVACDRRCWIWWFDLVWW